MPFAIVVDGQGAMSGIVTIEDLIEELVGEIFNEHARDTPDRITGDADGTALVAGTVPVRDVNRALDVELPEDGDWTTIAGLYLALAGKIPSAGERLGLPDGTTLEIIEATPRRIRMLRVLRASAPAAADPAQGPRPSSPPRAAPP